MDAIDKVRLMANWFDFQSEHFNQRIKTVNDIEKVYDYAVANDLEFMDEDYLFGELEEKERDRHMNVVNKMLRYKIY